MMISKTDQLLIKNAIKEAELKTESEIVPMITQKSDQYPAAHFRAAIIVSFLFSLGLYFSNLSIINPIYFLIIQIPGLCLGYFLAFIPFIKKLLITKKEINEEVNQKAFEAFFHHNLHLTKDHTGVLIFISLLEKKIKILADTGVSKKVDQKIWDEILYNFSDKIKNEKLAIALAQTIETVAAVLENHFPIDGEKKENQLSDRLIIKP